MDRFIENKIDIKHNKTNDEINEFIKELQNALEKPENEILNNKNLYNEIYNDLQLAPKYQGKLKGIIENCMLEYSNANDFFYLKYDEKDKKYYMEYYDGDITRVELTKKDIKDANYKVGGFYFPVLDGKYLEEADYLKDIIKEDVVYVLNNLEKENKDGN